MSKEGKELRERRVAAGLTIREVAEAANITEGYLSYLERGKRKLNPQVLADILAALKQLQA